MEEIVLIDSEGNEQKYNILHTFGVDDYEDRKSTRLNSSH